VRKRTQISLLASISALALGLGIPIFAIVIRPSTDLIDGTVVAVVPKQHSVLIRSVAGTKEFRGRTVIVHVPVGQKVRVGVGEEELNRVLPGQHVTATVQRGSFEATRISVSN
jgi:hypothetical protein